MILHPMVFKGLLKTLAGQFIDQNQDYTECIGNAFGNRINENAKKFFSISLIKEDLPHDLVAIGVLVDNRASAFKETGYTFFIFIDTSKGHEEITNDLKTMFSKKVLSHETCHFAYYYALFLQLGADLTSIVHAQFQNIVSGKLNNAITNEMDVTSQTVIEEHGYEEFLRNFWGYPNAHYDKENRTGLDFNNLNSTFFGYLK